MRTLLLSVSFAALLVAPASAVTMDWVTVADPGNASGPPSVGGFFGSVAYVYRISKYEVTNAQYVEFLNAKAASDPLGLYHSFMGSSAQGGIIQSGTSGSFTYDVKSGHDNKPVNYVSFYDALRFTNWLHNGQGSGDSETGAYTLLGGTAIPSNGTTVTRNADAVTFLPSEDEWVKAAYYDALSASYFDYPAGTDTPTVCAAPGATPNTANCRSIVGNTTDVGSYTESASPTGTFDQGGNVWELTEGVILRGGAFNQETGDLSYQHRESVDPSFGFGAGGFRVASVSVPEPAAGLLLITGLLALTGRRRRN